jgi:hypothetical protein
MPLRDLFSALALPQALCSGRLEVRGAAHYEEYLDVPRFLCLYFQAVPMGSPRPLSMAAGCGSGHH